MTSEKNQPTLVCPSCGQPVRPGFLRFKISDKVKVFFALSMIGYFALSLLMLGVISPLGSSRGCRRYDYLPKPERCKENEFKLQVEPLNNEPALQVFVGGGLIMGILVLYWDWLQDLIKNRRQKSEVPAKKREKTYRHQCRHCGHQWN